MKRSTLAILAVASLMLLASACKRNQTNESAAAAEDQAAARTEDQAEEKAEAAAPDEAKAPADATETASDQAVADTKPAASARTIDAISIPADWVKVSAQTPKGVTLSFGVPSAWVEIPPPNKATLLERGALVGTPAAGTTVTGVATEFIGGRTELAESTAQRLASFATIEREGALRVGNMDGYELVARWKTGAGNKDTVQLLLATGEEAIGVTCKFPPGQLEALAGLCDKIFGTVSIEGTKPGKKAK